MRLWLKSLSLDTLMGFRGGMAAPFERTAPRQTRIFNEGLSKCTGHPLIGDLPRLASPSGNLAIVSRPTDAFATPIP